MKIINLKKNVKDMQFVLIEKEDVLLLNLLLNLNYYQEIMLKLLVFYLNYDEYILYLKSIGLSYIFDGKDDIDIKLALKKLKNIFGIKTILMEGGSILNGAFLRENLFDELVFIYFSYYRRKR